jgi:hypothetical protein
MYTLAEVKMPSSEREEWEIVPPTPPNVQHPRRPPDVAAILGVLARHGVRYVLTGSVAALAYGVQIGQAGDLDITPALDADNLHRLGAVLREIEAGPDPAAPFGHWETRPDGEQKWVIDPTTPELQAQRANWSPDPTNADSFDSLFTTRLGNFDVVPAVSGTFDSLLQRALRMHMWGYAIWVVHIDELLAALTVPRRPKDVSRVRSLRQIQRERGEHDQHR